MVVIVQRVRDPECTDSITAGAVLRSGNTKLLESFEPVLDSLILELWETRLDDALVAVGARIVGDIELVC